MQDMQVLPLVLGGALLRHRCLELGHLSRRRRDIDSGGVARLLLFPARVLDVPAHSDKPEGVNQICSRLVMALCIKIHLSRTDIVGSASGSGAPAIRDLPKLVAGLMEQGQGVAGT